MNNRLTILWLFSFCFFFLFCNKNIKPNHTVELSSIRIQQLRAMNLSEDMNELSTKEDEILLLIFLIDQQDSNLQVIKDWTFEHTFKKRGELLNIDFLINLENRNLSQTELVFMLIELDNINSKSSVTQLLKQAINKELNIQDLEDFKLDKLLKHDDFLDFQSLNLSAIKKNTPNSLKFKGLQLFDRFEYQLHFKIN